MSAYPVVTMRREVPVDRGVQGVCNRLRDQTAEIERLERELAAAKRRRVQLILKLRTAGLSLRKIEPLAGMTNARICQIARESEASQPGRNEAS